MDGVLVRPHLDSNGKDLTIEHIQDVEPILHWNQRARRDEQRCEWGRHVARIPNVIYVKWLNEEHARGNTSLRMFTPSSIWSCRGSSMIPTGRICAPTGRNCRPVGRLGEYHDANRGLCIAAIGGD
jgi:hypothetical protein